MPIVAALAATTPGTWVFLALALALALAFEFVNGFHDTANAVATVIYTHSLKPWVAVIWSGLWNLTGVMCSAGGVAFSIVALLPVELVLHVGTGAGFAMVFALLLSAITWNAGTWYLGLPASSSHSLVGSILGVGIAHAVLNGHSFGSGINWAEAHKIGMALLISPVVGFAASGLLVLLLKALVRNPALFQEPDKEKAPPLWIRSVLVLTCTGVSFAHGQNDGQKGMGLIVLILVGVLPATYALKMDAKPDGLQKIHAEAAAARATFEKAAGGAAAPDEAKAVDDAISDFLQQKGTPAPATYAAIAAACGHIEKLIGPVHSLANVQEEDRAYLRTQIYLVGNAIDRIGDAKAIADPNEAKALENFRADLAGVTQFIPFWVKVAVAVSLGLGTMIGWKRIVVTVGEKIGKSHLTYGQGASAELVAMLTILAAEHFHLPVSTTHVLSSGVAGTMAANRSGLQMETLRNILLAWVLTLPACMFLGSLLFAFGNYLVLRLLT